MSNFSFICKQKPKTFLLLLLLAAVFLGLTACGGSGSSSNNNNDDDLPGNSAPTASDGNISVVEDGSVNGTLVGDDADGDSLTFNIVGNASKGDVTITDAATGAFTYAARSGETGDDSFTFNCNDGTADSNTATVSVTIEPATGRLLGSVAQSPDLVTNIDTEGTLDWVHWGYSDTDVKNVKESPPVSLISNYSFEPDSVSVTPEQWNDSPISFSWPAGTGFPIGNAADNTGFLAFPLGTFSQGQGIKLEVPADTTARTLRLYLGTTSTRVDVTATLSDGSAADYTGTVDNQVELARAQVVTLNYAAASDGQTLTILLSRTDSGGGRLNLYAATLAEAILPAPVIAFNPGESAGELEAVLSAGTDIPAGAEIRYEVGASPADPTESSALYSDPVVLNQSGTIKAKAFYSDYTNGRVASMDYSAASDNDGSGISGFVEQAPSTVADIDAEGTLDWVHWGLCDPAGTWYRCVKEAPGGVSGNLSLFANYSVVNYSTPNEPDPNRWTDSPIAFSWPDGTEWPADSDTDDVVNTTNFISFPLFRLNLNGGIQFDVPADTTARTLRLYLGTTSARASVTATLSNGNAAPYTATIDNTLVLARGKVVTLDYAAAADGGTLTVEFTYDEDTGVTGGALNLHAATLK